MKHYLYLTFLFLLFCCCKHSLAAQSLNWEYTGGPAGGGSGIGSIASNGYYLMACVGGTIFRSADDGETWAAVGGEELARRCNIITQYHNTWYTIARDKGIYRSTDNGFSWEYVAIQNETVQNIYIYSDSLLFASGSSGFLRSTDRGKTWTQLKFGQYSYYPSYIQSYKQHIVMRNLEGWFHSIDSGKTFKPIELSMPKYRTSPYGGFWLHDSLIVFYTTQHQILRLGYSSLTKNWSVIDSVKGFPQYIIQSLFEPTEGSLLLYCYTYLTDVANEYHYMESKDNGKTWKEQESTTINYKIDFLQPLGKFWYTSFRDGIARSSDKGRQWQVSNKGISHAYFTYYTGVTDDKVYYRSHYYDARRSQWQNLPTPPDTVELRDYSYCTAFFQDTILISTYKGPFVSVVLYRSTNGGSSWSEVILPDSMKGGSLIDKFYSYSGRVFVWKNGLLWASEDKGEHWYRSSSDSMQFTELADRNMHYPFPMEQIGNSLLCFIPGPAWRSDLQPNSQPGFYRSETVGRRWNLLPFPATGARIPIFRSMVAIDSMIFLGSQDLGIYVANLNELPTHKRVGSKGLLASDTNAVFLGKVGRNLVAVFDNNPSNASTPSRTYVSSDLGESWKSVQGSLFKVQYCGIIDGVLYAHEYGDGLYKADLSKVVSVEGGEGQEGKYEENTRVEVYPQPAASRVHIRAKEAGVELEYKGIYDIEGKSYSIEQSADATSEMASLVIDVSTLPSGIYILRLRIGEKNEPVILSVKR